MRKAPVSILGPLVVALGALLIVIAAGLLFAPKAHAGDKLLGSIVSAGASTSNTSTAAPFAVSYVATGTRSFEVQCTAAVYISESVGASAATSANVQIQAGQLFSEPLVGQQDTISILPVSGGAATCNVYAYTL